MWTRCLAILSLAAAMAGASAAQAYPQIAAFGDSLSDNGNAYYANTARPGLGAALGYLVPQTPTEAPYPFPPAPNGTHRYTNGDAPVGVELLARRLGLALPASLGPGGGGAYVNYAIGGGTTGAENLNERYAAGPVGELLYPGLSNTGLQSQIDTFQARLGGAAANPEALYFVWAGANDVFLALANATLTGTPFDAAALIARMSGNLAVAIDRLYALGARDFLIANLPDLGLTPASLGSGQADALTAFSAAFNAVLDQQIDARRTLPGMALHEADTFALLRAAAANPGAFGFANVRDACLDQPTCMPGGYLFWDDVHPTAGGHRALGVLFASALGVPEPATLALLAVALAAAGAAGRRRAQMLRFFPAQ